MTIDDYRFGRMRIDGKTYQKDLLIVDGAVQSGWWRGEGHRVGLDDLRTVLAASPRLLIIGTGAYGMVEVLDEVREECRRRGIELVALKTGKAVEQVNARIGEPGLAAGFHLTC